MKDRRHLLSLCYNRPLIIEPAKLQVIIHILEPQSELTLVSVVPETMMAPMKPSLPQPPEGSALAVVEVMGSLVHRSRGVDADSGLQSYESIGNELKVLRADPRIGGILLRMDTPGGEVSGVYELARTVRETAQVKPVWTLVDGMGMSAGYLIASQTRRILLGSHASVGSIGVIMIHLDQSKADEAKGHRYTVLKRGNRKDDFNPHAPLAEGAMQFADRLLDREYDLFVEHVAAGRKLPEKKIRATEAGIYFDDDALTLGLADGSASFEDAVGEMREHVAQAKTTTVGGINMGDTAQTAAAAAASPPEPQLEASTAVMTAAASPVPRTPSAADYEEIVALCRMARKPQLAAAFISERRSVAEVREVLMRTESDEDGETEVFSAINGQAGVAQSLIDAKPKITLAQAMKRRLGLQQEAR